MDVNLEIDKLNTELIEFTNKNWEHDYIKPMFEDIIVPTVTGLKAYLLFLQMDKTNTQNNLILFLHILMSDGTASEYFALHALFDFLMIFDGTTVCSNLTHQTHNNSLQKTINSQICSRELLLESPNVTMNIQFNK